METGPKKWLKKVEKILDENWKSDENRKIIFPPNFDTIERHGVLIIFRN